MTSRGVFIGGLALLSTYDPPLRLPSASPIQALLLLKKKLGRVSVVLQAGMFSPHLSVPLCLVAYLAVKANDLCTVFTGVYVLF